MLRFFKLLGMLLRLASLFRRRDAARAQQGAIAIEFALLAPVIILLLMGIIEFGLIMWASTVLEGATSMGARVGKSGATTSGMTREQYIRNEIKRVAGGLLDPNAIVIGTQPYPTFNTTGNPPPEPCITARCGSGQAGVDYSDLNGNAAYDAVRSDSGMGGDVVVYRSTYDWPLKTPIFAQAIGRGATNSFTITAVTVVRNEPF